MKPSEALELHRDAIRRVVLANGASNPRVFGSVLHGDDTEVSDIVSSTTTYFLYFLEKISAKLAYFALHLHDICVCVLIAYFCSKNNKNISKTSIFCMTYA
jgi:hypothetical protein